MIGGGPGRDLAFHSSASSGIVVRLKRGIVRGGGPGINHIYGIEKVLGGPYRDLMVGDHRNNFLFGYRGDDVLRGGPGDDILKGSYGRDRLNGGPGTDICRSGAKTNCER